MRVALPATPSRVRPQSPASCPPCQADRGQATPSTPLHGGSRSTSYAPAPPPSPLPQTPSAPPPSPLPLSYAPPSPLPQRSVVPAAVPLRISVPFIGSRQPSPGTASPHQPTSLAGRSPQPSRGRSP